MLAGLLLRPPVRAPRRPAASGAAVSGLLAAATLPLSAIMRRRAVRVGLVTQSWGGWAGDTAKSTAIGAGLAAVGAEAAAMLERRFGRDWWLPGSAAAVAAGAAMTFAAPVVLAPLFNRFTPLAPGPTRGDVLDLARRAGVRVDRSTSSTAPGAPRPPTPT